MKKEIIEGLNITDRLVLDKTDENFNVYPNIDAKYGPYPNIETALSTLVKRVRSKGLTVGIVQEDNTIVEYWFRFGTEDDDLVEKALSVDYEDVIEGLEDVVFPLEWESYNPGQTIIEIGNTITPRISWTIKCKDKFITPDRVSVTQDNNVVGEVASNKLSWDRRAEIRNTTSYYINVFYGDRILTRKQDYNFRSVYYYGVTNNARPTAADILGLGDKDWTIDHTLPPTNFICNGGKYPVIAMPTDVYDNAVSTYGGIRLYIGGFKTTDLDIYNLDITNRFGYTENYTVIKLKTIQTGTLNIEIQ